MAVKDAYGDGGAGGGQQRAQTVLKKVVMKLLDEIYNGEEPELQWVRVDGLERSLASKWGMLGLTTMLQHRPCVKVGEAIKFQGEWKISSRSGLGSLCSGLLQTGASSEELVRLVGRVVERVEVNWKAVLTLLTISTELLPQSDTDWHTLISGMVRTGLEESDQEAFISGLLLARQSALSATPSFPSYSSWFHTSFGDEQTSLAAPKRSHQFLVSQLTSLVPFEPAYTMKVHITRPPAMPRQMKEFLEEYKSLARTQLATLGELASDIADISNNSVSEETFSQVMKYVDEYSKTGKIPPALVEASMFRKPFFSSQLLPALLLVKVDGGKEAARGQMVELLNKKGKVPGPLYNSFISGELRRTAVPEVKLPDEECTEDHMTSCLGVLSHLTEPEDIKLMLGQVSYILRTLLKSSPGGEDKLTLSCVLSAGQDKLAAGLHHKILQAFLTGGSWRKHVLPLITSSITMLRQTVHWVLTSHTFHQEMVELLLYLNEIERSKIEVKEGVVLWVADMLGTMYHSVNNYEQLDVMEKILKSLLSDGSDPRMMAKFKHLENRRQCFAGEDLPHSYDEYSVEDVKTVLEMEANMSDKVDILGQIQRLSLLQACAEQCGLSQYDLASCLLSTLLSVWDYCGIFPPSTLIMIQAVSKVVQVKVWLQLWRQEMISMTERMITIFELVPGMVLESAEDVTPLVSCRSPSVFGLCLPLCRLVWASRENIQLCPVVRASLAYWAGRGCVSSPPGGEMQPFYSWRGSSRDDASSVRVGLILLAEDYLRGVEDISKKDNPVVKKLATIVETVGQDHVESVLSHSPKLWFPNVISNMLSSSISLLMIILCTATPAVLSPSLPFCVHTLLPNLSELMDSMEIQAWDLGQATTGLVRKLQEFNVDLIKKELGTLEIQLHQDLEELLNKYMQH